MHPKTETFWAGTHDLILLLVFEPAGLAQRTKAMKATFQVCLLVLAVPIAPFKQKPPRKKMLYQYGPQAGFHIHSLDISWPFLPFSVFLYA